MRLPPAAAKEPGLPQQICHGDRKATEIQNTGGGVVTETCLTLVTLWTVAHQTPESMEFPRQEYWSGLAFPSPGDLPSPGIRPVGGSLQVLFIA